MTRSLLKLFNRVLDTKLFDYEKAESSAGWIRRLELQGGEQWSAIVHPETEEYGISSFTYRVKDRANGSLMQGSSQIPSQTAKTSAAC